MDLVEYHDVIKSGTPPRPPPPQFSHVGHRNRAHQQRLRRRGWLLLAVLVVASYFTYGRYGSHHAPYSADQVLTNVAAAHSAVPATVLAVACQVVLIAVIGGTRLIQYASRLI